MTRSVLRLRASVHIVTFAVVIAVCYIITHTFLMAAGAPDVSTEEDWRLAVAAYTARSRRAPAHDRSGPRSELAEYILIEWAYGQLSPPKVQAIAARGLADIERCGGTQCPPLLVKLARIGNSGKSPEHCKANMINIVKSLVRSIPTTDFQLPLKIDKGPTRGPQLVTSSIVSPTEWVHMLHEHYPDEFKRRFLGSMTLRAFWEGVHADDPRRLRTDAFDRADVYDYGIPIALYGDGVPCTTRNSLMCHGWESIVCELTRSIEKVQYVAGYYSTTELKLEGASLGLPSTQEGLWQILTPEFRMLRNGVRADGSRVAGNYYFVPWLYKCDHDWKVNTLGLPGHPGSLYRCSDCTADVTLTSNGLLNFRPDAQWKAACFARNHPAWLAHCAALNKPLHRVMRNVEDGGLGFSVAYFHKDTLHTLEFGPTAHIIGNVLWHFAFTDILAGESAEKRMDTLWGLVCERYRMRKQKITIDRLVLASFCDPTKPNADFPLFKSKAAEAKHLLPILADIWRERARPSDYEQHMVRVLDHLKQVYASLAYKDEEGKYPMYLPQHVIDNVQFDISRMLVHYNWLTKAAEGMGKILFNVVPKFHHLWHLGRDIAFMSCRYSWTYGNEDWVGRMSMIGYASRSVHRATQRPKATAEHWILGQCVEMTFRVK